jgi:hypothetical protein
MEIEFELNQHDLKAFADYQVSCSPRIRARINRNRIVFLVGLLILALGTIMSEGSSISAIIFVIMAVLQFFFLPSAYRWIFRRHFANSYKNPANRLKYRRRKIRITDDGLEEESEEAHSNVKWSTVQRVDRTKSHGYIYLTDDMAYIIPKDALGERTFTEFMDLVMKYSNQNAA